MDSVLQKLVDNWIAWDPNPESKKQVEVLKSEGNFEELERIMRKRIEFGTAGLRGRMTAGFSFMNNLTVIQASQGLCMHLLEVVDNAASRGVVIGYDGRYNSKTYAEQTAATFLSKGFLVYLFREFIPTPYVAYAVTALKCVAGVVVTASHNPKDDNGYKVYWSNGCQIVNPIDKNISNSIKANLQPWGPLNIGEQLYSHDLLRDPGEDIARSYNSVIQKWCFHREQNRASKVKITYTAMHGVGAPFVLKAFEAFSLPSYVPVKTQVTPDPDFSTVAFPNPEEGKGALKLSFETADKEGSPVIIANDPDADRMAAAELISSKDGGSWVVEQYINHHPNCDRSQLVVMNTTVSSKMLQSLAEKEGLCYMETLTGFKWLGSRAEILMNEGKTFLFAYEEAIGYMIGSICLDKDGVRAAAVFGEMIAHLYGKGLSLYDQLQTLREKYGYFQTQNRYFFCYDPSKMRSIFKEMRNEGKYHSTCGKFKIKGVRDLTGEGYDSRKEDKKPLLPTSSSEMITWFFENGAVVTLRGSGTEPKLKYYCELNGTEMNKVTAELNELVDSVIEHFLQPKKYDLQPPRD